MPATRRPRTSTGPLQKGSQKTLSFGPSKAGKTTSTKDNLHSPSPLSLSKPSSDIEIEVKPEDDDTDTKPSIKIKTEEEEIHKVEPVRQLSAAQEKASKVTDQQIKKYWKARQDERITPRVHQADLSLEEKVLRLWDMSSSFGPAIGITRLKRWERAERLGLRPPVEVLGVLMRQGGGKEGGEGERAYVEGLMGGVGRGEG